jgi:hypothetical protein
MDIWGDDPWANDATQQQEQIGLGTTATKLSDVNGFNNEAGWGDFTPFATDNSAQEDPWSRLSGHEEEEAQLDLPIVSPTAGEHNEHDTPFNILVPDELFPRRSIAREDSSETGPSSPAAIPNAPIARTEGVEDEAVEEVPGSQNNHLYAKSRSTRPLSSSSEATITTSVGSIFTDRTSLEQGIPDAQAQIDCDGGTEEQRKTGKEGTVVAIPTSSETTTHARAAAGPDFKADPALLNELFVPRSKEKSSNEHVSSELIDFTSTRKVWYRLSRKQTLRAFLSGDMPDAHVRVAWHDSRIRTETVGIVRRWIMEDRAHGRTALGGSAKLSFGWDEPRAANNESDGASQSSLSHAISSQSKRASTFSISTPVMPVASFGWSTSLEVPSHSAGIEHISGLDSKKSAQELLAQLPDLSYMLR